MLFKYTKLLRRAHFLLIFFILYLPLPSCADEKQEKWTEVGTYLFASRIDGYARIGGIISELDIPFSDIWENLDLGIMAFCEHRHNNWIIVGDFFYVDLGDDRTISSNEDTTSSLEIGLKQIQAEGFVGYRIQNCEYKSSSIGIDVLGGARRNSLELKLFDTSGALGLPPSLSGKKNWTDGVIALRAQYNNIKGWGITGWADLGVGSNSDSYQLMGFLNYKFQNMAKLFCGYRHYHFEYGSINNTSSPFAIDTDYSGPMLGISYTF